MYQKFLLLLATRSGRRRAGVELQHHWSFGPFIAVLFLLGVNLVNFLLQDPLTLSSPEQQRIAGRALQLLRDI